MHRAQSYKQLMTIRLLGQWCHFFLEMLSLSADAVNISSVHLLASNSYVFCIRDLLEVIRCIKAVLMI